MLPPRHLPGAGCPAGASWCGPSAFGPHGSGCGFPTERRGTHAGEDAGLQNSAGAAWAPRPRSPLWEARSRDLPLVLARPTEPGTRAVRPADMASPTGPGRALGRSGGRQPCSLRAVPGPPGDTVDTHLILGSAAPVTLRPLHNAPSSNGSSQPSASQCYHPSFGEKVRVGGAGDWEDLVEDL